MTTFSERSPKKVLIVRLGAMGDIAHAMPAVAALRDEFPHSDFGWVVEKRWAGLLTTSDAEKRGPTQPLVDRVHVVETRRWRQSWTSPPTFREIRSTVRDLRACRYDVAIDFQGSIKSGVFAALSGAGIRFGFADPWESPASLFYTQKTPTTSSHVVDQNFELGDAFCRFYGAANLTRQIAAPLPKTLSVDAEAARLVSPLDVSQPFVILNPGAGWGAKQWPAERYAKVARVLGEEGIQSLVNYGPGEEEIADIVVAEGGGHAFSAKLNILQLTVVARQASLFIGGDTGPLHLAALLRVPAVAIFGPTDPARNGPYGTNCIVLRDPSSETSHKRVREIEPGLLNVTTDQVLKAARELLGANREGARA